MLFDELFDPSPSDETPIACDLSALDDPAHHAERFEELFDEREEVRDLPGGLAVRFPGEISYAERILDFVSRERQCCPFLTFGVAVEPEGGGTWLYMGGDERVDEYLSGAFGEAWM